MSEIIFALPRTFYGSYADEYRLIELSGFKTCFIDEIDPHSDNAFIITVLNGEIPVGGWPDAKAHIVIYDLEWRTQPNAPIPGVAEFWTGDKWHAELCQCRYVPMGSHPELRLASDGASPVSYDAAFLGYMTYRRQHIYNQLKDRGVQLPPTSAWGEERHRILSNSRTYVHVHQLDNVPGVPPLRMVVAAAYSLPVISETCADQGVFTASYMLSSRYDEILPCVQDWTRGGAANLNVLQVWGDNLYRLLCVDFTFRRSVEAAL